MCAEGQIAINVRGLDVLQAKPAEDPDDAWNRMKGKLGTGKHLDETIMLMPDAVSVSGGKTGSGSATDGGLFGGGDQGTGTQDDDTTGTGSTAETGGDSGGVGNLFGGSGTTSTTSMSSPTTSSLNLLQQVEKWGIGPGTSVKNIKLQVGGMTGAQLQALIKYVIRDMPDGAIYGLELEKEEGN